MSVVADFSVPAEAFCLGESLEAESGVTAELDRLVAHSPDYVMPFVWLLGDDQEVFEAALVDDATVESFEVTDSFGDTHLYQFSWAEVVRQRLQVILDHSGSLLEARGSGDEWRLWVRFGSREHFGEFQDFFQHFGEITLHSVRPPQTPGGVTFGVSPKQRESLLAAYDAGYYDDPSGASGSDLAEQFGISQQAFSGRLRRGVRTLIENTVSRHRQD